MIFLRSDALARRSGFTLIELLAVIAVLGILVALFSALLKASVTMPSTAMNTGTDSSCPTWLNARVM